MTVSNGKSIAEILDLLGERCIMQEHGLTNGTKQDEVDEALAALEEIVVELVPPEQDIPWLSDYDDEEIGAQHQAEAEAANNLREEMLQNIRQAFSKEEQ